MPPTLRDDLGSGHSGPIKVVRENIPNFVNDGKPPAARTKRQFRLWSEYMFMFIHTLTPGMGTHEDNNI